MAHYPLQIRKKADFVEHTFYLAATVDKNRFFRCALLIYIQYIPLFINIRHFIHSHFDQFHTRPDSHVPLFSGILLSSENRRDVEHLAADYEKSIYKQLMAVMAHLDSVEDDLRIEKVEPREDVENLNCKIDRLTRENILLHDDNARLKSIIDNDSSNTSLPPSTDKTGGKSSNTYNGREKTNRKAGGQKGHHYVGVEEKRLLNRMEKYGHNHLLFLHNFEVPFDDNMSERDLRKAKNRQKMAGGFRKDSGHEMEGTEKLSFFPFTFLTNKKSGSKIILND